MKHKSIRLAIPALVLTVASGCSKSSSGGSTSDGTNNANPNVKATSVSDLNLAGVLNLNLDSSITGTGTSLTSLLAPKSAEACRVRQSIKQSVDMLQGIKAMLCHVEAESTKIGFNKPVLLKLEMPGGAPGDGDTPELPEGPDGDLPDGPPAMPSPGLKLAGDASAQYMGIYVDTTDANATKVYMCSGEDKAALKLTQSFTILSAEDKKSKGEMLLDNSMGDMTFAAAIAYDAGYTKAGTTALEFKVKFGGSFQGETNSMAQYLNLQLVDGGVSTIKNSDSGNFMGSSMNNAGIAKFDDKSGQIIFALDTSYGGQAYNETKQSCVDAAGYVVACSDAKFTSGGDLYVTGDDVPGFLGESFSPTAPSGFDCAAAQWTEVAIDLTDTTTMAAHEKCDEAIGDFSDENCWDAGFEMGEQSVDLPERGEISGEQRDPNEDPLVPPPAP